MCRASNRWCASTMSLQAMTPTFNVRSRMPSTSMTSARPASRFFDLDLDRVRVGMTLGGVLDRALDEGAHMCVGERIEDVLASSAARHDSFGAEEAQLLRDSGEPYSRRFGELRHAPLPIAQAIQELQTGEVAGRAEDGGCALELLVVDARLAKAPRVLFRSAVIVDVGLLRAAVRAGT